MLNKKLSDLFLRKESKKQQHKQVLYFDQSYFCCKVLSKGLNTDLIRIQTQLKDTGLPLDQIKCKWYIKNSHDFKEIQEVTSSYYQPCLDDVGSIICVQIEPFLEGRKYNGITIMEETEQILIDNNLEQRLDNFLEEKNIKFEAKIEAIYSQNPKFQQLQLPLEVTVSINQEKLLFFSGQKVIEEVPITQEFPCIEFIRKTFNSILFNYNQKQSMKLSLSNNFNRDLFTLIVRTCAAHRCSQPVGINPQKQGQESSERIKDEPDLVVVSQQKLQHPEANKEDKEATGEQSNFSDKVKSERESPVVSSNQSLQATSKSTKQINTSNNKKEGKHSSTLFILKLDEVNKELKALKLRYDSLEHNYNIQKQGKCLAETQLIKQQKEVEVLKKQRDEALAIAKKVKQLKEDNRFYKNQILIIKKEWKQQKEKRLSIESDMKHLTESKNEELGKKLMDSEKQYEKLRLLKLQSDGKRDELEVEIEKYKAQLQNIQNENHMLKKKLESLAHEKGINKKVIVSERKPTDSKEAEERIKELEMKLKSLEMLLKYKGAHGDMHSNFQLLVNKLTETITQKQLQLNELKKVNKNLLEQLKETREKIILQ